MSKIAISPVSINGDAATSVTLELFYNYTSSFNIYYTYYNAGGVQLQYGHLLVTRGTLSQAVENNINIEMLWALNKLSFPSPPVPANTNFVFSLTGIPTFFRYELFEPYISLSYTDSNGINGKLYIDGGLINSSNTSQNIISLLGLVAGGSFIAGEDTTKLQTEDGKTLIIE